jgi:hypothetical protein
MTKSLEDELNLPRLEDALRELAEAQGEEAPAPANPEVEKMANALANTSPIAIQKQGDKAGVQEHQIEADDIYEQAMRAHKDLMDLGFNIEPKNAGPNAFQPALKALEIALKASQSKATKKMERIKLIMEQEKHDREMNQGVEDGEIIDNGGSTITANRNDLMEKIRKGEI